MPIIEPEGHEIETAAFYCFKQGGERDGHALKDWLQGKHLVFMAKNYDVIAHHSLKSAAKEQLWNQEPRRCRYCGAVKPAADKWKEAHAIPELVGNKTIIAMDECTTCNETFSSLEDDLGKMLHLSRAICRIEGKKGVPSFPALKGKSRIDVTGDKIEIKQYADDPLSKFDEGTATIDMGGKSAPFTPLAVYKSLTKMALAIMPPAFLPNFAHTIDWIKKKDHAVGAADVAASAKCRFMFQPGPMPPDYGHCTLLGRKSPDALIPYMLFSLTMANQTFQIMVPCTPGDNHLVGHKVAMPEYPAYYGFGYEYEEPVGTTLDLASPDKVRIQISGSLTGEATKVK